MSSSPCHLSPVAAGWMFLSFCITTRSEETELTVTFVCFSQLMNMDSVYSGGCVSQVSLHIQHWTCERSEVTAVCSLTEETTSLFLQSEEQRSWELNVSSGCLCFHLSEESESVWWQQSCVVLCISCGIFTPLVKMQVIVCVCRSCWTRWVPLCSTTGTMICIRTRITVMTCDAFGLC